MEYKIINTGDYLLIVDDSEIKEGGWHYNLALNFVEKTTSFDNGLLQQKIIAHLPLNNSPILEGVDLLPPIDKIPVGFKCEIIDTSNMGLTLSYPLTKKITNSQGLTQWVGEYLY